MNENIENTFTSYLGPEFQQKLMWQLLVEPEFAERVIPNLAIEYFDDPNLKRLFIIILQYVKEFDKVPNFQNKSIHLAINKFKTPNNMIEEESLFGVIKRVELWNRRMLNKEMLYDGEAVQQETNNFIKQQEWRKFAEFIIDKVKNGEIKKKHTLGDIDEKLMKISHIGDEEDYGTEVTENIDRVLRKEFRMTIPTGMNVIDALTGGGLGKGEIGVILTPSGVGKAQPLSSKILTPNGWIRMGEVRVGSDVIGSDGKPQKVLGVYPQGERDIYKIEFNDGTSALCDEEHLWSVNSRNNRTANTTVTINGKRKHIKIPNLLYKPYTLKEIRENYKIKSGLNYRIPIIKCVEFTGTNTLVDPYLLGCLIGDGGLSDGGVRFTSIDKEIINNITNIINENYEDLSVKQVLDTITYSITGKSGKSNLLFQQIKNLGLNVISEHKHIPKEYIFTSKNNRISLLQGLMDTDGYASKTGRLQFTTCSKQLSEDVRELVLSLGGFCKIKEKQPKYKYLNETKIGKLSYILTISLVDDNIKPFSLERKQCRVVYREKYKNNKYISNIEYSHKEEAQCIYVQNDDHLYVTNDFILTHNTTALTKIANTAYDDGKNVLQIVFEDTVEQIQRKHFTLWSKVPLSEIDDRNDEVKECVNEKVRKLSKTNGHLIIKRMSQENTTMLDVRNWITRYQKKWGFNFDIIVLDYLDCLDSHKRTNDRNEAELVIIKSFEAMAADLNIPAWTAIQSNRSGFDSEFVEAYQTGGSIKRVQKAHFFMSVAKTPAQKESGLANVRIIKARFAKDGQTFSDCIFDNDSLEIRFQDENVFNAKAMRSLPKKTEDDVKKMENMAEKYNSTKIHLPISEAFSEEKSIDKANDDTVNDTASDTVNEQPTTDNNTTEEIITETPKTNNDTTEKTITETNNDNNELLDIDENEEIKTNGDDANEGVNEGVNGGVNNEPLLEITGNTEIINVNENNVNINSPPKIEEKTETITENLKRNDEKKELEKLLIKDPDTTINRHMGVFAALQKLEEKQSVQKKE